METGVDGGYGVGSEAIVGVEPFVHGCDGVGSQPIVGMETGMDGAHWVRCEPTMCVEPGMHGADGMGGEAVVGMEELGRSQGRGQEGSKKGGLGMGLNI